MLKKIALIGVFALTSVFSVATPSKAARDSQSTADAVKAPTVRGLGPCGVPGMRCG